MKDYEYIAIYVGTHQEPGYDRNDPPTTKKHNEWKGFESEAEMLDWVRQQRVDIGYNVPVTNFKLLKVTEVAVDIKIEITTKNNN